MRHLWAFFNAQMVKEIDHFMKMKVKRTSTILTDYQGLVDISNELRQESFGRLQVCLSGVEDHLKKPAYQSELISGGHNEAQKVEPVWAPQPQEVHSELSNGHPTINGSNSDPNHDTPSDSKIYESNFQPGRRAPAPSTFHDQVVKDASDLRNRRDTRRVSFFGQADAITEELFSSSHSLK